MTGRQSERGAVAVLVAVLCVVLFSFAAFAVDLSNAFVRTRDVQRQADFAALAGGAELKGEKSGPVPAAVIDAVRDELNGPGDLNLPQDDKGKTAVTSADLTDGVLANGEVRFADGGLQVVSPQAQVDYGFAKIMGHEKVDVSRDATVGVFSPGFGVLPVYAVDGCDWGRQALTDPASGAAATIPPLAYDSDSNATELDAITAPVPAQVVLNASGVLVKLHGKKFKDITKVGFFRADDTDPAKVVEQPVFTPAHTAAGYSTSGPGEIEVVIPDTVTNVETAWYIRVYSAGTTNKWSDRDEAQPLRVGDAVLECDSASSDGNFGTLKLPRINPAADSSWVPVNFAAGLEKPLTLAIHAAADATGLCINGFNGAVESIKPNLKEDTNCVDTDTGLTANDATDGLISGNFGYPGRLEATSSSTSDGGGCAPGGSTSARTVSVASGSKKINDDVLTCYLTNGSTSLADITDPDYSGGPVLSPDIYNSPRFYWQPVLGVEPDSGGSKRYSIIDFRAAFITDEVVVGSTIRGTHTATSDNGIHMESKQVKQIKAIFFNADALPADDSGVVVSPYLGVGPKILRLID